MMRRSELLGVLGGIGLAAILSVPVLAHNEGAGSGISVEPDSVQAGGSVILAGTGLEPNSDRVLVLAGPDITIDLGTVKTDAQGMFEQEIKIPVHLPGGRYEFRAIGDETLTTAIGITAAPGMGASSTAGSDADETVVAHHRAPLTEVLIIGGALILLVIGGTLIWRAESFGRSADPAAT